MPEKKSDFLSFSWNWNVELKNFLDPEVLEKKIKRVVAKISSLKMTNFNVFGEKPL